MIEGASKVLDGLPVHRLIGPALKLAIAAIVALVAIELFKQVLPPRAALDVGILFGISEFAGAAFGGRGGNGGGMRLALRLGEVVLAWPLVQCFVLFGT